jgi:putative transposase
LLGNHAHLLFFSGPSGLSVFMRRLLTGYAQGFNRRHKRSGHLFQNRYKSIVCEEDAYLLELIRYIHLNPLRASLVKNLWELDRYPWSGHRVLLGREKSDWQERGYVLGQFHRKEREAIGAYRRFMEEGKDLGRRPELVGGGLVRSLGGWSEVLSLRGKGEKVEYDARILGGGDFVAEILREAEQRVLAPASRPRAPCGSPPSSSSPPSSRRSGTGGLPRCPASVPRACLRAWPRTPPWARAPSIGTVG